MRYRPLGLVVGALSLLFVVACGGSSSDSDGDNTTTGPNPTVEAPAGDTEQPEGDQNATVSLADGLTQDPVAIVNGEDIPLSQLQLQLGQLQSTYEQQGVPLPQGGELTQLRQQVLDRLVQQTLVLQESEARGITAEESEVQEQYDQAVASFPDKETFEDTIESEGLTEEDFRELISKNIRIEKMLNAVVDEANLESPTEDEVQQLYDQANQQQQLPPLDEIRAQIEEELVLQKENEVLLNFVNDLQEAGDIQILLTS